MNLNDWFEFEKDHYDLSFLQDKEPAKITDFVKTNWVLYMTSNVGYFGFGQITEIKEDRIEIIHKGLYNSLTKEWQKTKPHLEDSLMILSFNKNSFPIWKVDTDSSLFCGIFTTMLNDAKANKK